jgi:glycosyltransferase involved in cell wall biosynthesis
MKVLIAADPELPVPPKLYGGIERIIDILVRGLRSQGHTVVLVAHRESTCNIDCIFPWPGLRSQITFDTLRNTVHLRSVVQEFQPDVLHSFSRLHYMLPLLPSRLPKIMSYQRKPTKRTVSLASKLANHSLTFTGCSQHICRQGLSSGGVWHPIYNFVEIEKFTFQPVVAPNAPLVFLSRIEQIKGAHTAIAIALQTQRRLIIAGNQVESAEGKQYWQNAIEPHLGKQGIEYIGPVNDSQKNELLGRAAAMIVPIEWDEPFGIVFAEALACGTPVISCPRGSLPEIVRPGIDGYLIQSIEEGCVAVQNLSNIDRAHCRQRAEECFSAQVIVGQYEKLYQGLMQAS